MKKQQGVFWLGLAGLAGGLAGILLHLAYRRPYSDVLIVGGFTFFAALYSIRFAKKEPKRQLDYAKLAVAIFVPAGLAFIVLSEQSLLKMFFGALGIASYAVFYFMGGLDERPGETKTEKERPGSREVLSKVLLAMAIVLVFIGAIFKIQHWPYAPVILLTGLVLGTAWFVMDSFRKQK